MRLTTQSRSCSGTGSPADEAKSLPTSSYKLLTRCVQLLGMAKVLSRSMFHYPDLLALRSTRTPMEPAGDLHSISVKGASPGCTPLAMKSWEHP